MTSSYWKDHRIALSDGKFKEIEGVCAARAEHEGEEQEVFFRTAAHDGKLYIDMGDDERHVIEIDGSLPKPGWRMRTDSPVKFRRASTMGTLPWPVPGHPLTELRDYLNASTDEVFIPMVAWLLGTFAPEGPYPILLLGGPEGCAKTTQMSVLRQLIDPTTLKDGDKRAFPSSERDLAISANTNWVMSYDNLSDGLQPWMSDALCRIATGGAFATRALYANDEEVVFTISRPIIANGIDDIAARADLVSRSMIVSLHPIPKLERQTIKKFKASYEAAKPRIFGALLTAVSAAMKRYGTVDLPELPRMADFITWVAGACEEGALPFTTAEFLECYELQARAATSVLFEASSIGTALREFASQRLNWNGTASELLAILDNRNPGESIRNRAWPKAAQQLAKQLRRDASTLEQNGIRVQSTREGKNRTRMIHLKWIGEAETGADDE